MISSIKPNRKILDYYTCSKTKECQNTKCWIRQVVEDKRSVWIGCNLDGTIDISNCLTTDYIQPRLAILGGPPGGITINCYDFQPEDKKNGCGTPYEEYKEGLNEFIK